MIQEDPLLQQVVKLVKENTSLRKEIEKLEIELVENKKAYRELCKQKQNEDLYQELERRAATIEACNTELVKLYRFVIQINEYSKAILPKDNK